MTTGSDNGSSTNSNSEGAASQEPQACPISQDYAVNQAILRRRKKETILRRRLRRPSERSEDDDSTRREDGDSVSVDAEDVELHVQEEPVQRVSEKVQVSLARSTSTGRIARIRRKHREHTEQKSTTVTTVTSDTPDTSSLSPTPSGTQTTPTRVSIRNTAITSERMTSEKRQETDGVGAKLNLSPSLPSSPTSRASRRRLLALQRMQKRKSEPAKDKEQEEEHPSGGEDEDDEHCTQNGEQLEECTETGSELANGKKLDEPVSNTGEETKERDAYPAEHTNSVQEASNPAPSMPSTSKSDMHTAFSTAEPEPVPKSNPEVLVENKEGDTSVAEKSTSTPGSLDKVLDSFAESDELQKPDAAFNSTPMHSSAKVLPNESPPPAASSVDRVLSDNLIASDEAEEGFSASDFRFSPATAPGEPPSNDESLGNVLTDKVSKLEDTVESECAFDFRSIHQHPPTNANGEAVEGAIADPSWDANKVFFSEFVDESKKTKDPDLLDVFATDSWGAADVSFATSLNDDRTKSRESWLALKDDSNDGRVREEKKDEKKDSIPSLYAIELAEEETHAVASKAPSGPSGAVKEEEEELDPTGWPRVQIGFLPALQPDPFETNDTSDLPDTVKDDENLLSREVCRSEAGLSEILGEYEASIIGSPKLERIADYSIVEPDEASLEAQTEDEDDDDSDTDEDVDDICYEPQDDDCEDDDVKDEMTDGEAKGADPGLDIYYEAVEAVPTFEAAAFAAVAIHVEPATEEKPVLSHPASTKGTTSDVDVTLEQPAIKENHSNHGLASLETPPPPPQGSSRSPGKPTRRSPKTPTAGASVPLLAPPPEEKLREWEETTQSQLTHLAQKMSETINSVKKEPFVSEFPAFGDFNDSANLTPSSDLAVMFMDDTEVSQSPAHTVGDAANNYLSPVSSSAVIHDTKLAEKVDLAISVAALKFEEQVSLSSSDAMPTKQSVDELARGAFSAWKNAENSGSDRSVHEEKGPASNAICDGKDFSVPIDLVPKVGEVQSISTTSFGSSSGTIHSSQGKSKQGEDVRSSERKYIVPPVGPSPFDKACTKFPNMLSVILSFLGDPVAVCRIKMTSKACQNHVSRNEHQLMRDAVRYGGMAMNVRPYFWLWVTLQKGAAEADGLSAPTTSSRSFDGEGGERNEFITLEHIGREGKWHSVIERDVARSFGNLPPHKTGARLRTDSIVRALVTWGKNRLMKRGVKGCGPPPTEFSANSVDSDDDVSLTPADTVSDWGGVTPVGSFTSSVSCCDVAFDKSQEIRRKSKGGRHRMSQSELALSGNALSDDMKASLQGKLSFILHALAAAHSDVGYCQGEDYIVAHLLRILQDTIRWKAANGSLPSVIKSAPRSFYGQDMNSQQRAEIYEEIDRSLVVEEVCFRVMDSFFTNYSLRHFYWPELRCLKTCCLVFERLIQIKLPVLADHFEHHELNVGLFALGWFQTLFLYLPSMPTATVTHVWDIWLVERSFKIFFRVGTAILFLSQPILLNHELEGMMSYLNTFPDATLLSPDILIACALQIKVTNRMLMELEEEVTSNL